MPYEDKCLKYSDENYLCCEIKNGKNGKEECSRCKKVFMNIEGKCHEYSLENCVDCYFYEGKEECFEFQEGYGKEGEKCFNWKILDERCKYCSFCYYTVGISKYFKCDIEIDNRLYKMEKCSIICSVENCLKCSLNSDVESCDLCKDGYKIKKDKNYNGKCVAMNVDSYDFSSFKLPYCNKYLSSGKCVECYANYKINDYGKCKEITKEKGSISIAVSVVISIVFFVLFIIICCVCLQRFNNQSNERRISRNNLNNINNNVYLYGNNQNEQWISSNEIILNDKNLCDEFNKKKIKLENKLYQGC